MNFLERIEEGLGERKTAKREIEEIKSQDEFILGIAATTNGGTKGGQEMIRKSSMIDETP